MRLAEEYIYLNNLWEDADKDVVLDNIERVFGDIKEPPNKDNTLKSIMKITGTSYYAVYAWFNRSRENVKVPLLKLCELSEGIHVDVLDLLTCKENWVDSEKITRRQKDIYNAIRQNQYYSCAKLDWDIEKFVSDIDVLESYKDCVTQDDKLDRLSDDCKTYFNEVVCISDQSINDRIEKCIYKKGNK